MYYKTNRGLKHCCSTSHNIRLLLYRRSLQYNIQKWAEDACNIIMTTADYRSAGPTRSIPRGFYNINNIITLMTIMVAAKLYRPL